MVAFRLERNLGILLFIVGEPQKLDMQKCISPELFFHKLSENTTSDTLEVLVKLYPDWNSQLCITC